MCRAELPSPPLSVIVPIPIVTPTQTQTNTQKVMTIGMFFITLGVTAAVLIYNIF
jgi:membrane protein insertase Oxa1/YidC/SpoIIIJ